MDYHQPTTSTSAIALAVLHIAIAADFWYYGGLYDDDGEFVWYVVKEDKPPRCERVSLWPRFGKFPSGVPP